MCFNPCNPSEETLRNSRNQIKVNLNMDLTIWENKRVQETVIAKHKWVILMM